MFSKYHRKAICEIQSDDSIEIVLFFALPQFLENLKWIGALKVCDILCGKAVINCLYLSLHTVFESFIQ